MKMINRKWNVEEEKNWELKSIDHSNTDRKRSNSQASILESANHSSVEC